MLEIEDDWCGRLDVEVENGRVTLYTGEENLDGWEMGSVRLTPEQWVQVVDYVAREMAK